MPLDELHEILVLGHHDRRPAGARGVEDHRIVGLQERDLLDVQRRDTVLACQPARERRGQLRVDPHPYPGFTLRSPVWCSALYGRSS